MLLRALSMDDEILREMAVLYRYFDKIPSEQFYMLLIGLVPKGNRWVPWIKTKVVRHSPELLSLVAKHYEISKRQANEYVNVLIASEAGLENLLKLGEALDNASLADSREIIGLIFPENFTFRENKIQTARINEMVNCIYLVNNRLRAKKNGTKDDIFLLSRVVTPTGQIFNIFLDDLKKLAYYM